MDKGNGNQKEKLIDFARRLSPFMNSQGAFGSVDNSPEFQNPCPDRELAPAEIPGVPFLVPNNLDERLAMLGQVWHLLPEQIRQAIHALIEPTLQQRASAGHSKLHREQLASPLPPSKSGITSETMEVNRGE